MAFEHVQQLERRNVSPNNLGDEPLSAITDDYFKAIIRAVLDDQMDLVRVQIDSNLSVSRQTLEQLTKLKNLKKPMLKLSQLWLLLWLLSLDWRQWKNILMKC